MIWEDPTVWESQGRFINQVTELDCQDVSRNPAGGEYRGDGISGRGDGQSKSIEAERAPDINGKKSSMVVGYKWPEETE